MIVVATEDFQLYHEAVTALRDRGVTFTTMQLDEELPERTTVLITAPDETVDLTDRPDVDHVTAASDAVRPAVEHALSILRGGEGRTVIGVDPGSRPGVAVLDGETVVSAFQLPLAEVVDLIEAETADLDDPLVRIGDGARLQGAQIINELDDVAIEIVDETGTTPYLGTGTRGMGDVLAAVNIARISGEAVESRTIEPTAGELQRIKNRSREQSTGDRTIPEALARQVAAGELTIEEALRIHREPDATGASTATDMASTETDDSADRSDESVDSR